MIPSCVFAVLRVPSWMEVFKRPLTAQGELYG
jgi:hypothetical protein